MRNGIPILALIVVATLAPIVHADERGAADVTEPPPYEDFLVVPLRVHVLRSEKLDDVDCKLKDADIHRVLGKVNGIWRNAGVHFRLESIVREDAAEQDRFRIAREMTDGKAPHRLFRILRPEGSRRFDGIHVYYIHDFDVNGVFFLRDDFAFVRDTARLREVEGGIDEPIPRVTSHELGHALGLPHRQDRTNLLASGTTGTLLNADEVAIARDRARSIKGALTVAALRNAAQVAEHRAERDEAREIWSCLAAIPGAGANEARRRLDALDPSR